MPKQYYECHITMLGNPLILRPQIEKKKWKFSCIDGDPTFGTGIKCYATRHYNKRKSLENVIKEVEDMAFSLRWACDGIVEVLRSKVELVVYDNIRK